MEIYFSKVDAFSKFTHPFDFWKTICFHFSAWISLDLYYVFSLYKLRLNKNKELVSVSSIIIFVFISEYFDFIFQLMVLINFIILLQIEEGTRGFPFLDSPLDSSTWSLDSLRSPTPEIRSRVSGAKKSLLKWVKNVLPK